MAKRLQQLFDIRRDEIIPLLVFTVLLAVNQIALEGSYILSTSGFLKQLQLEQFPLLWLADMVVILLVSGAYSLIVDRVARLKLVSGLLFILTAVFILFRFLFLNGAPDWLTYPGLYLAAEQQYVVFPLAFWALANDRFTVAQSKRLFPLIATGGLIGQVLGGALGAASATVFAQIGLEAWEILSINAVLLTFALALLLLTARRVTTESRQDSSHVALRDTVETGLDFVRNVPSFRYLALSMLATGFVLVIIEYYFLFTADQAFASTADFQTFYGIYRVALTLATLVFQGFITGRMLTRAGLKNSFLLGPGTMVTAVSAILLIPGIVGGAAARFLGRLFLTAADKPAAQTFWGLIPEERRGRVSTFMSSYLYVLGNMIGSTLLLIVIPLAAFAELRSGDTTVIYVLITLIVALFGFFAIWRMREEYDQSLLNWRLARRRRRGNKKINKKLDNLMGALDDW
ncbi:MAG: Npt1/Npt2 family nucleotide transporter [Chloroflexota bacterium]